MTLEPWMRIGQPLENVLQDYERVLDAWDAGGIRGLVFGRLVFADAQGEFTIPAFPGKIAAYRERGLEAEELEVASDPAREKLLHDMLENASARGWKLLIFCPGQGAARVRAEALEGDLYGAVKTAAVWDEIFSAFPEVDGGIMDGWTESPYEPVAGFRDLSDPIKDQAEARGYDAARLERGMLHLKQRFQNLTPGMVRYYGAHGVLAEMNLFDINEDALYWLRWRQQDGLREGQALRRELDKLPRRLLLGNGLRSAVFSGMTGVDFHAWDEILDYLLVKHYFWHRGYDGLYGTVWRWVRRIHEWNPGLSEQDSFAVARAWLGVKLPEVDCLADMDLGFPQAFFDQVVQEETRRALAATSAPGKIVPWVDTGRMPHRGDPMTAGDLHRILVASEEAGLQRFLFHNHAHLTAAEWCVISRLCGTEWDQDEKGYWPPNTPRPFVH